VFGPIQGTMDILKTLIWFYLIISTSGKNTKARGFARLKSWRVPVLCLNSDVAENLCTYHVTSGTECKCNKKLDAASDLNKASSFTTWGASGTPTTTNVYLNASSVQLSGLYLHESAGFKPTISLLEQSKAAQAVWPAGAWQLIHLTTLLNCGGYTTLN
jgi:hypothetical protein